MNPLIAHPQAAGRRARRSHRARAERGVVLFVALIVLVAMMLAGLTLLRSVHTSNRVVGNLAFQQAATRAADVGIETAIAWLETTQAGAATLLHNHVVIDAANPVGYFATRQDPGAAQSWEQFWTDVLEPSGFVTTLAPDAAGNTVSFVIHRLCNGIGDPLGGAGCEASPTLVGGEGGGRGAGVVALQTPAQIYYRITARVLGPRNAVGFVQVVVAM